MNLFRLLEQSPCVTYIEFDDWYVFAVKNEVVFYLQYLFDVWLVWQIKGKFPQGPASMHRRDAVKAEIPPNWCILLEQERQLAEDFGSKL